MNNKNKGFTLIELLLGVGFLSVASVSTYSIATYANDFRTIKSEVSDLSEFIKGIENTTNTTVFNDEAIQTFQQYKSNLELASITSKNGNLLLNYSNVKSRICVDFVSKMISANKNISAVINGKAIGKNDLNEISSSCFSNTNELSIVVNKSQGFTINTITASVNTPPPPHVDVVIPEVPIPIPVPQVAAFTPSTANPVVYGITGVAPVYPVVPPAGGPMTTTPGTAGGTPIKPPVWTPPAFTPAGPATPAPPDDIDQNPLPPVPPPPQPTGITIVKGETLNICRPMDNKANGGTFYWYGNMFYTLDPDYKYPKIKSYTYNLIDYFNNFGNFGAYAGQDTSPQKMFYNNVVSLLPSKNPSLNSYICANNGEEANGIPINQK